jgi:hypothetical protein
MSKSRKMRIPAETPLRRRLRLPLPERSRAKGRPR